MCELADLVSGGLEQMIKKIRDPDADPTPLKELMQERQRRTGDVTKKCKQQNRRYQEHSDQLMTSDDRDSRQVCRHQLHASYASA